MYQTHCISLKPEQETKLQRVKSKYPKMSIAKMLMATVEALDEPEALVAGQPLSEEE